MRDSMFSSTIIEDGFTLFVKYFCLINSENMKIQMTVNDFIIMNFDLFGMDTLWDIAVSARDGEAISASVNFLTNLEKKLCLELTAQVFFVVFISIRSKFLLNTTTIVCLIFV